MKNLDLSSTTTSSQPGDADEHAAKTEGDFQRVTRKILGVIQLTTSVESHAKALLLSIEEIKRSVTAVQDLIEVPRKEGICKAGAILANKLNFPAHRKQIVMNDIQFIEKRTRATISGTSGYREQVPLAIWLMR